MRENLRRVLLVLLIWVGLIVLAGGVCIVLLLASSWQQ